MNKEKLMESDFVWEESMTNLWNVWITELHQKRVGLTVKVKQTLYSEESPFQRIDILDTYEFGRMLVLYGSIMTTEKDEFFYHEMISHVPLFAHPNPKNVLIIGGGDGGTLREVVRHKEIERAVMVEIDELVVEKCKEYLPSIAAGFDDPRAEVIFQDGLKFLDETNEKFDVIIVDGTDPVGPGVNLFKKNFYKNVYNTLKDDGIFVQQTESPIFHPHLIKPIYENLNPVFPNVKMYLTTVPTYPGFMWSFCYASKRYNPFDSFRKESADELSKQLKYYNSDIHRSAFSLPNFVREIF